jgi:hypothetical protein
MQLWDHGHPGIYIDTNGFKEVNFFVQTSFQLWEIEKKPTGEKLLRKISDWCQKRNLQVTIQSIGSIAKSDAWATNKPNSFNKQIGSSVDIRHCSKKELYKSWICLSGGPFVAPYVTLAHELVHALHCVSGTRKEGDFKFDIPIEEIFTVGLGEYAKEEFTENAIRKEHGLELRTWFSQVDDISDSKRTSQESFELFNSTVYSTLDDQFDFDLKDI